MMAWPEVSRRTERAIRLGLRIPKKRKTIRCGQVFGRLTVISLAEKPTHASAGYYWLCQCECGKQAVISTSRLNYGRTKSCGCLRRDTAKRIATMSRKPVKAIKTRPDVAQNPLQEDLKLPVENGSRFYRLVVHNHLEDDQWLCRCDCGIWKVVRQANLSRGHTKSCGCWQREWSTGRHSTHRMSGTKLYGVWASMIARCTNPNSSSFARYGGRGIYVDSSWGSFEVFMEWALGNGYAEGLHLDRRDNDGPYSATNCRFVTPLINGGNTRKNVRLSAFGESKTIAEWARDPRSCAKPSLISSRIKSGWSHEQAIVREPLPGVACAERT